MLHDAGAMTWHCSRCDSHKPIAEMCRDNRRKDGVASECMACKRLRSAEYESRPEVKARKSVRASIWYQWQKGDPEFMEDRRHKSAAWRAAHPEYFETTEHKAQRAALHQKWKTNPEYVSKRSARNRSNHTDKYKIIRSAKDRPCADCGNKFHACAMDFDHVRGEKLFNIGSSTRRSVEAILKEIEKCEVVCSNCHRVRTYNRRWGHRHNDH